MTADLDAELAALRQRLAKLRRLHGEKTAVAEAAGELLAQERTFPRPRREVERELETAVQFDLPMLTAEIAKTEAAIATLEGLPKGASPEDAEPAEPSVEEGPALRARCLAIADTLTALRKRTAYVRELAAASVETTLDLASIGGELARTERGVTEIEAALAVVERCVSDTAVDLRWIVIQRAPNHEVVAQAERESA